jgi:hypothetical protein
MSGLDDPLKYKRFFNQFGGEYNNSREIETYDNLQAEFAGIYGVPIEYYTIHVDGYKDGLDVIYGENSVPVWDRKFQLTGIIDEYSQELMNWQAAGPVNIDEVTMYIHRSTFDKLIGFRSLNVPVTDPNRRGGWGPVPKDIIKTPYNGFYYEVITGGVHFMDSRAQQFGHKFWYKVTLKSREISDTYIGKGEQYGGVPDPTLQQLIDSEQIPADKAYTCNPQAVVGTPAEMQTSPATGMPSCIPYQDPITHGDQERVEDIANQIIDPQTNEIVQSASAEMTYNSEGSVIYVASGQLVPEGSDDWNIFMQNQKYGNMGRVIRNNRDLWGDW